MTLRIAWGITGCGDYLKESLDMMKELTLEHDLDVRVFLSQAGEMVVKWYKLFNDLKTSFPRTYSEKSPNVPFLVGDLQLGKYDFIIITPSTSNTVAKIAAGISDTLLSNAAAQAMRPAHPIDAIRARGPLEHGDGAGIEAGRTKVRGGRVRS